MSYLYQMPRYGIFETEWHVRIRRHRLLNLKILFSNFPAGQIVRSHPLTKIRSIDGSIDAILCYV